MAVSETTPRKSGSEKGKSGGGKGVSPRPSSGKGETPRTSSGGQPKGGSKGELRKSGGGKGPLPKASVGASPPRRKYATQPNMGESEHLLNKTSLIQSSRNREAIKKGAGKDDPNATILFGRKEQDESFQVPSNPPPPPPTATGVEKQAKANRRDMTLMIVIPWLSFFINQGLFISFYHRFPMFVITTCFAYHAAAIFVMFVDSVSPRKPGFWYMKLAMLSFFGCFFGALLGLHSYYHYIANYHSLSDRASYINVLPSQAAEAHADAGKIVFSVDSKVDLSKSAGFSDNHLACVAPIMDYATDVIQYWAAGVDCCHSRGRFTCDDVLNPNARSGVTILDNRAFFPSLYEDLKSAVTIATATYKLKSAKEPLFVRWVTDPESTQYSYWSYGIGVYLASSAMYLLISLIAGVLFQLSTRKVIRVPREKHRNLQLPQP